MADGWRRLLREWPLCRWVLLALVSLGETESNIWAFDVGTYKPLWGSKAIWNCESLDSWNQDRVWFLMRWDSQASKAWAVSSFLW